MINQAIMPKAYKEVYEIVKHLSEEDFFPRAARAFLTRNL